MRKISVITAIMILALLVGASLAFASGDLSGKVIETMDSGGYTYVQIENKAGKTWVAIPQAKVKVGDTVSFIPGSAMPNFTSKSLKRTFKTIIFSPGLAQ